MAGNGDLTGQEKLVNQRLLLGIMKYDLLFLLHAGALLRPFFSALTLLLPSMQRWRVA